MDIHYQGADITDLVQVSSCVVRDTAGNRCDSLEIEFENAAKWYAWGPVEDDRIVVAHNGYDSGIMYVNKILPEDGRYRILAGALPCKARTKKNRSFENMSIEEIMRICAASSGMGYQIFGLNGQITIPYIERSSESCAAFLYRLLTLEGAVLKCINGKYTAIGLEYAQSRIAAQTIDLTASQEGVQYTRDGMRCRKLTIVTPYASGMAEDALASAGQEGITICGALPAKQNAQAKRWAKGKLLATNRKSETVTIQSEFNPRMSAMVRMDIEGNTDAAGEWLIEEAEHDLVNGKSKAILHRCVWSIE